MLNIPQNLLARVKNGESIELLESYLMNNYPMPVIIKAFAELIIINSDFADYAPQIAVTEEEMQMIARLFRIKGTKLVNGELIKERRGRPKKIEANERTLYNQDEE